MSVNMEKPITTSQKAYSIFFHSRHDNWNDGKKSSVAWHRHIFVTSTYLECNDKRQEQNHVGDSKNGHLFADDGIEEQRKYNDPYPKLQQNRLEYSTCFHHYFRFFRFGFGSQIGGGSANCYLEWSGQMCQCGRLTIQRCLVLHLTKRQPKCHCEECFEQQRNTGIWCVADETNLFEAKSFCIDVRRQFVLR